MDARKSKRELRCSKSITGMPINLKKPSRVSKSKDLNLGVAARIRCSRSTSRSSHAMQKRPILLDTDNENKASQDEGTASASSDLSPEIDSETRQVKRLKTLRKPQDSEFCSDSLLESLPTEGTPASSVLSPVIDSEMQQLKLPKTPRSPQGREFCSDSLFESLPMELLEKMMCHLHHDELPQVMLVSRRIRDAVRSAREIYFNYKTPDRNRQRLLRRKALAGNGDENAMLALSPQCPNAPGRPRQTYIRF